MSKVAVVYWSGTGNTEAMASAVVDGVREGGAKAELFTASEFDASMLSSFDAVAFGCPSMGSEQLEDSEFEPMFNSCEGDLGGKKIALFGSYGWGRRRMDEKLGGDLHSRRCSTCDRVGDMQRRSL